jgi:two-component system, OmpR family, phosphate regulon response regulator PhoB
MSKKYILIVEDDSFIATAYKEGLEREGFEVEVADDGEIAVLMMSKKIPDLILLDLIMPVMDGFEVLSRIKKDATLNKVPVVILSNLGQESDIEKGKSLGAEDYLVKADHTLDDVVSVIKKQIN